MKVRLAMTTNVVTTTIGFVLIIITRWRWSKLMVRLTLNMPLMEEMQATLIQAPATTAI
jgi:hypothetical protein